MIILQILLIVAVILSFVFLVSSDFPSNNQIQVQPYIYFPEPIKGKVKKTKEQNKENYNKGVMEVSPRSNFQKKITLHIQRHE